MDNLPRLIFYLSGIILLSGTFTLFTSEIMIKIGDPGLTGILFLLGFGLVYMNITFISVRRFMRKLTGESRMPYVFGVLIALPPVFWVSIKDLGLGEFLWVFIFTILFACMLGAYFGHRAGLKAQVVFRENMKKYFEEKEKVPDDLKRPHDTLNKN